jgi:anthranilate phosphoribosyltransferase
MRTFNISTTAAFVVAVRVSRWPHGGRSVSSSCGSADVLGLGCQNRSDPEKVEECLNEIGIDFSLRNFHLAMRHAIDRVKRSGRTIFILGPLTNPANASIQVLGVYNTDLTDIMAQVLLKLGSRHCFIVHGSDGLDEITITGKTKICEGKEGRIQCYYVQPKDFGLEGGRVKDIEGGDAQHNAQITAGILRGERGRAGHRFTQRGAGDGGLRQGKTLHEGVRMAEIHRFRCGT